MTDPCPNTVPTQTAIQAELDPFIRSAATVEELSGSAFFPCWIGGSATSSVVSNVDIWVAPFPLRIVSVDFVWSAYSLSGNRDYVAMYVRKHNNAGSFASLAVKRSRDTDGEPIVAGKTWGFGSVEWFATQNFATGDLLNLQWAFGGSVTMGFPMAVTFRYVPL